MAASKSSSGWDQARQPRQQRSSLSCPPELVRCAEGDGAADADETHSEVVAKFAGQEYSVCFELLADTRYDRLPASLPS